MSMINNIPDSFWSLFRSANRQLYIEAMREISEEYEYNNYFISWDICIQLLDNIFTNKQVRLLDEESEPETETVKPPAARTLGWLVRQGWLNRQEDYGRGITNVVIPDYAAVFLEAFDRLFKEEDDEADVYIRNIYASLFSYMNDTRQDASLLKGALKNTKILNKSIQNMLHNMNNFFSSLLEQKSYGMLLEEHLNGYVEEIVKKKYNILKTSDNFYIYKNDIKRWLKEIADRISIRVNTYNGENEADIEKMQAELRIIEDIERGFDDIEKRIYYIDQEHMKYIRATTVRLNYLINEDRDSRGMIIKLLNHISSKTKEETADIISEAAEMMNLTGLEIMSKHRFYKKRKIRAAFAAELEAEEEQKDLPEAEILRMNKTHNKYGKKQIAAFIDDNMTDGEFRVDSKTVKSDSDFEKLILSYDFAMRRDNNYDVQTDEEHYIETDNYIYPEMIFRKRTK